MHTRLRSQSIHLFPSDKVFFFINHVLISGGSFYEKHLDYWNSYLHPFNPTTIIKYGLKEDGDVSLSIYDVLGQEVRVLINGFQSAGYRSAGFNAGELPSGVYYYRLQTRSFSEVKKMLLLR